MRAWCDFRTCARRDDTPFSTPLVTGQSRYSRLRRRSVFTKKEQTGRAIWPFHVEGHELSWPLQPSFALYSPSIGF